MAHICEFPDETTHGYQRVMVHFGLKLCEVGENCLEKCEFSFKPEDVEPCTECKGNPNIEEPPYSCSKCDVFGIQRKQQQLVSIK